jgi:hypothetical protein
MSAHLPTAEMQRPKLRVGLPISDIDCQSTMLINRHKSQAAKRIEHAPTHVIIDLRRQPSEF